VTLAFYMDHHVQAEITVGLRARGIDVLTAWEDQAHELPDDVLLERATALDRVLFSEDQDLLVIAASWQRAGRGFAGLVFARQQRIDYGVTIDELELIARALSADGIRDTVRYVPLQ
jgi:hypothetical protein